jgi:hypothetical protein
MIPDSNSRSRQRSDSCALLGTFCPAHAHTDRIPTRSHCDNLRGAAVRAAASSVSNRESLLVALPANVLVLPVVPLAMALSALAGFVIALISAPLAVFAGLPAYGVCGTSLP